MKVVLDAGALIAVDRRDRRVGAMLRVLQQQATPLLTSGGVVAQVWRDGSRQANLARILSGIEVSPIDATSSRSVGELVARSASSDIIDAHVALLARAGDRVVTSDPADLDALLEARDIDATTIPI